MVHKCSICLRTSAVSTCINCYSEVNNRLVDHNEHLYIIIRYLQYAFDEKKIKSQDTSAVLSYIANYNPIGRHFAWNFLKEMWPTILERYVLPNTLLSIGKVGCGGLRAYLHLRREGGSVNFRF